MQDKLGDGVFLSSYLVLFLIRLLFRLDVRCMGWSCHDWPHLHPPFDMERP